MKNILVSVTLILVALIFQICTLSYSPAYGQDTGLQKLQELFAQRFFGQNHENAILKRFVKFDMSPAWWSRINAEDRAGTRSLQYVVDGIRDFAKEMKWGDVRAIDDSSSGTKAEKVARIESMLAGWSDKISVTLKIEQKNCDSKDFDLAMRYFTALGQVLDSGDFKPASGQAHVTLLLTESVKDITVTGTDGKNFVLKAPLSKEPDDWGTKIDDGFESLSAK